MSKAEDKLSPKSTEAAAQLRTIRVRLRPDLLARVEAEANRRGVNRDQFIADAIEAILFA